MITEKSSLQISPQKKITRREFTRRLKKDKWLYILLMPGILYFIIFKYIPMWGILLAFKDYQPFLGFFNSKWVGFQHFHDFFINPDFLRLFKNTLIISLYNLIFFFPLPIVISLMLNELKIKLVKNVIQTFVYIPHFVSMVIICSITYVLLGPDNGVINGLIFNAFGYKIDFLTSTSWFRPLIIIQVIWKETGWGTIIFLAALAGVEVELYEAAIVDGANRWQQMLNITLPAIKNTIIVLLILRLGHVLDTGFEQIFLMTNSLNREVADVFDTYVYFIGITKGAFSFSTAVGLFKSVIGLVLILGADKLAKKAGHSGIL